MFPREYRDQRTSTAWENAAPSETSPSDAHCSTRPNACSFRGLCPPCFLHLSSCKPRTSPSTRRRSAALPWLPKRGTNRSGYPSRQDLAEIAEPARVSSSTHETVAVARSVPQNETYVHELLLRRVETARWAFQKHRPDCRTFLLPTPRALRCAPCALRRKQCASEGEARRPQRLLQRDTRKRSILVFCGNSLSSRRTKPRSERLCATRRRKHGSRALSKNVVAQLKTHSQHDEMQKNTSRTGRGPVCTCAAIYCSQAPKIDPVV